MFYCRVDNFVAILFVKFECSCTSNRLYDLIRASLIDSVTASIYSFCNTCLKQSHKLQYIVTFLDRTLKHLYD